MGQALRGQRSWTDLGFLLLCEVIFDVEGLPDLLGGLSFDHVGHCLTGDVQQAFNVQVIGRLEEKSKRFLHVSFTLISWESCTHTS